MSNKLWDNEPTPPQDWLDKHGVELTGEYRAISYAELDKTKAAAKVNGEWRLANEIWTSVPHWILRKKQPPKPETVDVPVVYDHLPTLTAKNPNNDLPYNLCAAPCIVGPEWAFAGFVWEDGKLTDYYHLMVMGEIKYAVAVRFRRVQKEGGK